MKEGPEATRHNGRHRRHFRRQPAAHHSAAVVRGRDGSEALLPGSVPANADIRVQRRGRELRLAAPWRRSPLPPPHQICSLIFFSSSSMVRILKSMPARDDEGEGSVTRRGGEGSENKRARKKKKDDAANQAIGTATPSRPRRLFPRPTRSGEVSAHRLFFSAVPQRLFLPLAQAPGTHRWWR